MMCRKQGKKSIHCFRLNTLKLTVIYFKHMDNQLKKLINDVFPDAVRLRRTIHAHPELSGNEIKTAKLVFEYLSSLGLKPRYHINKTGVSARIKNGTGKTVVLRADMDALPIDEQTGVPFASKIPGVMHACGHDIHTACLLASAKVLCQMQDAWKGEIVLLFQPHEEVVPGGALRMIAEKAFPGRADAVFGLHVNADHEVGRVGIKPGRDYAGVTDFQAVITGKGGHAATPHLAIDPIVCACAAIMELQTIISRECPPYEPAVLTVGSLHAGTKNNIIPDQAQFNGTMRAFSELILTRIERRVREIVSSVARSFNASATLIFEKSYPPGYNNEALSQRAISILGGLLGKRNVEQRSEPAFVADDFAYFQKKAPGLYLHLGVRKPGKQHPAGIHSPLFLPDERSLKTGITALTGLAIDILS
jgi:amidohydrolase